MGASRPKRFSSGGKRVKAFRQVSARRAGKKSGCGFPEIGFGGKSVKPVQKQRKAKIDGSWEKSQKAQYMVVLKKITTI
jgi:hypothetical protein